MMEHLMVFDVSMVQVGCCVFGLKFPVQFIGYHLIMNIVVESCWPCC